MDISSLKSNNNNNEKRNSIDSNGYTICSESYDIRSNKNQLYLIKGKEKFCVKIVLLKNKRKNNENCNTNLCYVVIAIFFCKLLKKPVLSVRKEIVNTSSTHVMIFFNSF
ncbi:hypothetical protein RFI_36191 [Reticulomyxa filosa]|uniref:Uncharacterized protein n=1 Tax=Reticulomyxa filosa TaxID=46433 RepID=X6LI04_RETFI|nr:hypothetical protein RFI_36191 [Reticulomyxa filosa]|eukprot:ETO01249.1 hypothetical protein RFI_36191 [Reticulomyxa filosa]